MSERITDHPEGEFDKGGRWYPSDREDCGGDGTSTRSPSRSWPYSYMLRCRTREHCRALVAAALAGNDVPADVIYTAGRWRAETITLLYWETAAVTA